MQRLPYTCSMVELQGCQWATVEQIRHWVNEAYARFGLVNPPAVIYNLAQGTPAQKNKLIDAGFEPIYEYKSRHGNYYVTTYVYEGDIKYTKKSVY